MKTKKVNFKIGPFKHQVVVELYENKLDMEMQVGISCDASTEKRITEDGKVIATIRILKGTDAFTITHESFHAVVFLMMIDLCDANDPNSWIITLKAGDDLTEETMAYAVEELAAAVYNVSR
jgi:hypothetical protein